MSLSLEILFDGNSLIVETFCSININAKQIIHKILPCLIKSSLIEINNKIAEENLEIILFLQSSFEAKYNKTQNTLEHLERLRLRYYIIKSL
jgi:hypothetical protein